ncbi:MAG: hypothetical protein QM703_19765 [Gemmatales bacterium]
MQAAVLTFAVTLFLAIDPPEDNKYTSENLASSVRPPAADYLRTTTPKSKTAEKEVLSADDVKKIEEKKDKEVSVKGTVNEVFLPKSGSIAILNFGKDSKKCFKAVVFKSDFEKFEGGAEGIKKKYTGKTVTVEGKVSMYQGTPQIAVKTPSQFKVN